MTYKLTLKGAPDEYGFVYGVLTDADGQMHRVDILPPAASWRGGEVLPGYEPDAANYILYLDGVEVGRATRAPQPDAAAVFEVVNLQLPAPLSEEMTRT